MGKLYTQLYLRGVHAPERTKTVLMKPVLPWYNDKINDLKREKRKAERIRRRTKTDTDFQTYKSKLNEYTSKLNQARRDFYSKAISDTLGNSKKLFQIMDKILDRKPASPLSPHKDAEILACNFGELFTDKINKIRQELDTQTVINLPDFARDVPVWSTFKTLSEDDIRKLVIKANSTHCKLDPLPTWLLKENIDVFLSALTKIVNMSLQNGQFPTDWK
ncbi:hypothetical protein HOLleu_16491 [Holothuria leucospilota]|uniref:Uncharacterized protein n=1 Tax=Holothuria leucospilota TaxID=206669 RepID=A0A9Q1C454_HOLLE|nr:hypothetical protein HOLleu_16491 [Holothuria leucospilota]